MRREEFPIASQILKEQGVLGLHRPVGDQHFDFTWGIKVRCVCLDDGSEDIFLIRLDKTISRVKDGAQIHLTWAGFILVFGKNQLQRMLNEYVVFFNLARLHQGVQ